MSASSTRPLASSADEAAADAGTLVASVAAVVVLLDQLTKQWALTALADGPIDVVGSLRLNLSFNSGTAFSIGRGWGGLISLAGLAVVVLLLRGVLRWPGRLPAGAAGLVTGGAIGNLLDRVLREGDGWLGGRVVDFVDLQWWPIFNVADVAICTGAALLAVVGSRQPQG